jgi:hypothetical protein
LEIRRIKMSEMNPTQIQKAFLDIVAVESELHKAAHKAYDLSKAQEDKAVAAQLLETAAWLHSFSDRLYFAMLDIVEDITKQAKDGTLKAEEIVLPMKSDRMH